MAHAYTFKPTDDYNNGGDLTIRKNGIYVYDDTDKYVVIAVLTKNYDLKCQ